MRVLIASLSITAFIIADRSRASAEIAEVSVNQYGGPTECNEDDKVLSGKHLKIHFNGTIDESSATGEKGVLFHSTHSRDSGEALPFRIGNGDVIDGWDEGLLSLCQGAKVELVIPPEKGFGDEDFTTDKLGLDNNNKIPGGATLKYDIEIVEVSDKNPLEVNLFGEIDTNGDGKLDKAEVGVYFLKMNIKSSLEELWDDEDKDEDGFISWDEFSGPKGASQERDERKQEDQIFDALDANGDGKLTKEEYSGGSGDFPEEMWEKVDTDNDGFLSREEFVQQFSGQEPVMMAANVGEL